MKRVKRAGWVGFREDTANQHPGLNPSLRPHYRFGVGLWRGLWLRSPSALHSLAVRMLVLLKKYLCFVSGPVSGAKSMLMSRTQPPVTQRGTRYYRMNHFRW